MHTKTNIDHFDFHSFMREHYDDFVIIVSGSCFYDSHTGSYAYQTRYQDKRSLTRSKSFDSLSSPNRAMLEASLAACQRIQIPNKELFIVSPCPLGFKKGEKAKGPNADLVIEIFRICNEKDLIINSIAIDAGGQLIKDILANKI